MNAERFARIFVMGLLGGLILALMGARFLNTFLASGKVIEIHAQMAEDGGWTPANLSASVGQPISLKLTSDDVIHGFAIGQSSSPAVDIEPGKATRTTLVFDQPGKYVFYCTRWCGPGHWRMRGTIEVKGEVSEPLVENPPIYISLGIDIDAPHPASVIPRLRPSTIRGEELGITIPDKYQTLEYLRTHNAVQGWEDLRRDSITADLDDQQVWDLVAWVWSSSVTPAAFSEGEALYAENCAACHGDTGAGDGVMAQSPQPESKIHSSITDDLKAPANFTDPTTMLGASPALLQGKILRGGMGTGMPYWGPIFTEEQTWALVDYLWTFQFDD